MNIEDITRDIAADNIVLFATEGRLVQGKWHSYGHDGRQIACLLGSIHPDIHGSSYCPANVMPEWLAECIPTLFDGISVENVAAFGMKFADALRRGTMDDGTLRRFLVFVINDALQSADPGENAKVEWTIAKAACELVRDLIAGGAAYSSDELSRARDAVWSLYIGSYDETIDNVTKCARGATPSQVDSAILGACSADEISPNRSDESGDPHERIFDAMIAEMLRDAT